MDPAAPARQTLRMPEPNAALVMPTAAPTAPEVRWLRPAGWLLLIAAAGAFFFPSGYRVLQTVGTMDHRTLDAAGYEVRRGGGPVDAETVHRGDRMFDAITTSQHAAAQNKNAADRRSLALLLGLPGAFLLGRSRSRGGA